MIRQGGLLLMGTLIYCHAAQKLFSSKFIEQIGTYKTTWQAGNNFARGINIVTVKKMMGVLPHAHLQLPPLKVEPFRSVHRFKLPQEFDSRKNWRSCLSIQKIRDQGVCGSCWAMVATEVMTDRICINSGGYINPRLSTEDLVSCCKYCGNEYNGGYPGAAWKYYVDNGIVTGGDYNSKEGCKAFSRQPCQHYTSGLSPNCSDKVEAPPCSKMCDGHSNLNYNNDLRYGESTYTIVQDETAIKMEIFKNGPVQATMEVYEDFLHYKNGVYQHVSGSYLGDHSVKILGWGSLQGIPYWLAANSWNTHWGLNGYFMILRGSNHCNIESAIVAGTPKI